MERLKRGQLWDWLKGGDKILECNYGEIEDKSQKLDYEINQIKKSLWGVYVNKISEKLVEDKIEEVQGISKP